MMGLGVGVGIGVVAMGNQAPPNAAPPVSAVRQTLYPSSVDETVQDVTSGELSWPTTQSAAEAHDAREDTYDHGLLTGDHADPPGGSLGKTWRLGACDYAGVIDKIRVRVRAKQAGCWFASIYPVLNGLAQYGEAAPLTSSPAWYEFDFAVNPAGGAAFYAAALNFAGFGWVASVTGYSETDDLSVYVYEFEVQIWGTE
jgi:hypothetical protein